MTLVLPYLLPLMLGRSYDQRTSKPGVDLFSPETIAANTRTIPGAEFKSTFQLISSSEDVKDLMDVSGEFSLNALSGKVNVQGSGGYLKETHDRENSVEILCRAHYKTQTETLEVTSSTPTVPGWTNFNSNILGTHYVNSIQYGGELIASLKFKTTDSKTAEDIRGEIKGSLSFKGSFDGSVKAKLKLFSNDTSSRYKIEVSYYATTPVAGVPQTIDGLIELIDGFKAETEKVRGGVGNPISMVLQPLNTLTTGSNLPSFLVNQALIAKIDDFRSNYEDLLLTRRLFKSWVLKMTRIIESDQAELAEFYTNVTTVLELFYKNAIDLDVSGNVNQLDVANDAYWKDGLKVPQKFVRLFRALQAKILKHNLGSCFAPAISNKFIYSSNLVGDGGSQQYGDAKTVDDCKVKCVVTEQCTGVTFVLFWDQQESKEFSRCFVNEVEGQPNERVPSSGQSVYVYLRDRENCTV